MNINIFYKGDTIFIETNYLTEGYAGKCLLNNSNYTNAGSVGDQN
jgi:hypothetical protein